MTSFTELTVCDSETYEYIIRRVKKLSFLVNSCQWIINAYVSDFYTCGHWKRLPKSIQTYLDESSPQQISWLLDKNDVSPTNNKRVVPLYLLALQSSVKSLSLTRHSIDLAVEETLADVSRVLMRNLNKDCDDSSYNVKNDSVIINASKGPAFKNGQCLDMYHVFRRHVKPKKQHEIQNFGAAIALLASSISTSHVVDVGAGLGHLSRVLSFKHGLQVTTVEAADGHAPKAQQYDREMKKEIQKAQMRKNTQEKIISTTPENTLCFEDINLEDIFKASEQPSHNSDEKSEQSNTPQASPMQTLTKLTKQTLFHEISTTQQLSTQTSSHQILTSGELSVTNQTQTDQGETEDENLPQHVKCLIEPDIATTQFMEILSRKTGDSSPSSACPPFILTGLHACGDLTPTLLRVFAQCPKATGLASVGCCYHKMAASTNYQGDSTPMLDNYPMSNTLRLGHQFSLHGPLSHEAREMACHAADAYMERLESDSPHLKTHSFRAALQYLINQVKPDFIKGQVRIVSKKGSENSFTQYAKGNLSKVGIDFSTVPQDLLDKCETLTNQWLRVVGFYTLRLSLAPAVETLVLLDRMLFLYEQGISSVMVPIFDSTMSPRNFAILAQKG